MIIATVSCDLHHLRQLLKRRINTTFDSAGLTSSPEGGLSEDYSGSIERALLVMNSYAFILISPYQNPSEASLTELSPQSKEEFRRYKLAEAQ